MATKRKRRKATKKRTQPEFSKRLLNFLERYHVEIIVVLITMLAFYYRIQPAKYEYLMAIDPYYIYRMNLYAVTHNLHLPHLDLMRYYPTGIDPHAEYPGIYIIPAFIYLILTKLLRISTDLWTYAKIEPAVMGSLFTILIYLLGKELYNKYAGVLAAFFYATLAGVMFRTSAGFFEKEPNAGFFMLLSFYFFVRAIKRDSVLSAVASGLSMAIMATMWGGVQQLYLGYALFIFALLFVNRISKPVLKTYAITTLIAFIPPLFMARYDITRTMFMVNAGALLLLGVRELVMRKKLIGEDKLSYFMPSLYIISLIFLLVGGLFSPTLAKVVMGIKHYLFYQQALVESTVAENVIPTWNDFSRDLSLYYVTHGYVKNSFIQAFDFLFKLFPLWLLAFFGIFIAVLAPLYKVERSHRSKFMFVAGVLILVSLASYCSFLKSQGSATAQVLFIFPFIALIFLVGRYDDVKALYLSMAAVAMLGYFSRIRWMFGVGLILSIFAGFGVVKLVEYASSFLSRLQSMMEMDDEMRETARMVALGFFGFLAVIFLAGYVANANVLAKSLVPSFNQNWDEAMKFLRENTEPNATILSWWDFGYWFETMGNRSTNLDGGNNRANRNIPTAQYFTGMMNETQQKFFLEMMGTDYVLVDASMVGKYAAMSKIAQMITKREDYDKIRSYNYFYLDKNQIYRKGNATVYVYRSGLYSIWVPVNDNGSLAGNILFMSPRGEGYIKYVCASDRIYMLNVPENRPALDACVIITPNILLLATEDMFNSVFHKLFFMDGKGIDYLTKVFDNGEVKIYRVNHTIIPDRPREQLVKWWEKYDWKGLIVYNGTHYVDQKMDYSVFGGE